jgi:hypothetical protein
MTPLCKLAYKYGSDKCTEIGHSYTPFYYELLKGKDFKKVLELGIGSKEVMPSAVKHYQTGASLRMWRDFFPNAQVYGVDRSQSCMFKDDRITTFLLDTKNKHDMERLIYKIGKDIDLVIDDGSHRTGAQLKVARKLLSLLDKKVIYVVEDTVNPNIFRHKLPYKCEVHKFPYDKSSQNNLVVIRK